MEGKYTKISAIVGILALGIAIWQLIPNDEKNYSGVWNVESEITSAKMNTYVGMKIQWIFTLSQSKNEITGSAEKISVNSMSISNAERTTITINGTLDGSSFILNFVEKGKLRETRGQFKGEFNGSKLLGTFISTASGARGNISGTKVE